MSFANQLFYLFLVLLEIYLILTFAPVWLRFLRDHLEVMFFRYRFHKKQYQEFAQKFFLGEKRSNKSSWTLTDWDGQLLDLWAKEEMFGAPSPFSPQDFVKWMKLFPPEHYHIELDSELAKEIPLKEVETVGRDVGSTEDPAYLFLHGIWDTTYGFVPMAYFLWVAHKGKVRLLFQEMPGHGPFNQNEEALRFSFTYPHLARLVVQRLKGKGYLGKKGNASVKVPIQPASQVTAIGNSMGGAVSLLSFAYAPEKVSYAVPINPGLIQPKRTPPVFLVSLFAPPKLIHTLGRILADVLLLQVSASYLNQKRPRSVGLSKFHHWARYTYIWEPLFDRIARKVPKDLFSMIDPSLMRSIRTDLLQLSQTKNQILLLNGAEDLWLEVETMGPELIKDWKIPLESVIVGDAGHSAQNDQPQKLANFVWEWRKRNKTL